MEQPESGIRSNLEIPRIYLKSLDTDLEETKQRLHVLKEKFEKIENSVEWQLNSGVNKNGDVERAKKDFKMMIEKLGTEKNVLVDENLVCDCKFLI